MSENNISMPSSVCFVNSNVALKTIGFARMSREKFEDQDELPESKEIINKTSNYLEKNINEKMKDEEELNKKQEQIAFIHESSFPKDLKLSRKSLSQTIRNNFKKPEFQDHSMEHKQKLSRFMTFSKIMKPSNFSGYTKQIPFERYQVNKNNQIIPIISFKLKKDE